MVQNFVQDYVGSHGKQAITNEQAIDHTQCELGKWYQSKGKKMYGHIKEMIEFEEQHIRLHQIVKEIIALYKYNKTHEAEQKYIELLNVSDRLIFLLNVIETIVTNNT